MADENKWERKGAEEEEKGEEEEEEAMGCSFPNETWWMTWEGTHLSPLGTRHLGRFEKGEKRWIHAE